MKPWAALLLLAPAFGEVTCGNTPPFKFVDVLGDACMIVLYGGGALLIREAVLRFRKGWAALLLFGAAYGVVEEGLMCKSFFDPHWPGLGLLSSYGRYAGVNWVWAYYLTAYHAFYSIGFSILVAETLYRRVSGRRWVTNRGAWWLGGLLAADVILGYTCFPKPEMPYRPGPGLTLGALAAVVVFVALGSVLRNARRTAATATATASPWAFGAIGFLAPLLFFTLMFSSSGSALPPVGDLALATALFAGYAWAVARMSRGGRGWDARQRGGLTAGVLAGMVPLGLLASGLQGLQSGMVLVCALEVFLIVVLVRRSRETYVDSPAAE
jgi:hypothetical protein